MEVTFNRLHRNAVQPKKEGMSHILTAINKHDVEDNENDVVRYGTGLSVNIPEGYIGVIYPLIGIYKKKQIFSNSIIVIPSGQDAEIAIDMTKGLNTEQEYRIGNMIAQMVIIPVLDFNLTEKE
jgi:dUTP pyrophosphatase